MNCDAPPRGELVYLAFTKPWRSEGASALLALHGLFQRRVAAAMRFVSMRAT
jgi:hypothetical protein